VSSHFGTFLALALFALVVYIFYVLFGLWTVHIGVWLARVSTPLPQVTSPSVASSPVEGQGATQQTPTSAVRRRGRENGTPRRRKRSRSHSVGNPSSPFDTGTPGTPGTSVATMAYHIPVGNLGTPFGTPVGIPSFLRGTYPSCHFSIMHSLGLFSCIVIFSG
jgi:hypothetical protein